MYYCFMRFKIFFFVLIIILLTANCGSETDPLKEIEDTISFTDVDSNTFIMSANGENASPWNENPRSSKQWRSQQRILNSFCGGYGLSDIAAPITVISPDGALLGPLDDFWQPEWSPDGEWIAVACGRDDNGEVVVVSNYDKPGSSTGWSRSGKGALSDRMEIYAVTADGDKLIRITNNEAGDWLPKWRPNRTQLIFESNRDGNSEIYAATPSSSWRHRFTERSSSDQSPVWGENGIVAAFSSDVSGKSEIRVVEIWQDLGKYETNADLSTGQVGIPIPHQG